MQPQNDSGLIPAEAMSAVSDAILACPSVVEIEIADDAGMQQVVDSMNNLKSKIDVLDSIRKRLKEPFAQKASLIDDFFRPPIQSLKAAVAVYQKGLDAYLAKKEEEQKRLEVEVAAQAEAQRQQLLKEAEAQQSAAEAAEAAGDMAAAQVALTNATEAAAQADLIVAPVVERITPQNATITTSYIAETEDKKKAVAALMENDVLECFVLVDDVGLSQFATKRGSPVNIPGIRWRKEFKHKRPPRKRGAI